MKRIRRILASFNVALHRLLCFFYSACFVCTPPRACYSSYTCIPLCRAVPHEIRNDENEKPAPSGSANRSKANRSQEQRSSSAVRIAAMSWLLSRTRFINANHVCSFLLQVSVAIIYLTCFERERSGYLRSDISKFATCRTTRAVKADRSLVRRS